MAIIVMGVSGCGKSTLGSQLARALGCHFLEGDDFHDANAVAMMRGGQPLTDAERWPWLDRIGAALAHELTLHGRAVAACSALKRAYRERLALAAGAPVRFVLLDAPREELWRRLSARTDHYMPASLLDSQLATLEPPSPDEPAITLPAEQAPETLCKETMAWLAQPVLS